MAAVLQHRCGEHTECHTMRESDKIFLQVCRMVPGQLLDIDGSQFRDAYRYGYPTQYQTPEQSFLSKMMGSAWGIVRVEHVDAKDVYRISKHEASDKRHFVEPDREHLYYRDADGFYEPIIRDARS